jgi:hypothetical protein
MAWFPFQNTQMPQRGKEISEGHFMVSAMFVWHNGAMYYAHCSYVITVSGYHSSCIHVGSYKVG